MIVFMSFGSKLKHAIVGSTQGKVATIGYVVLLATIIMSVTYQNQTTHDKASKLSPVEIALVFILLFLAYMLAIYSINCMVVGAAAGVGCGLWAWANAIIVLVFAVAVVLSTFFGDKKKRLS